MQGYGVCRLIKSKNTSWEDYQAFYARSSNRGLPGPLAGKELEWGVKTANTREALLPDKLLPLVFVIAWSILVVTELVT